MSDLTLPTPDGELRAYEAVPDGTPRGGVVVIQEAFGVTSHIEDVCRRFAAAGWQAVAPHLFHRTGSPVFSYEADMSEVRPQMGALKGPQILADVDAVLDHLNGAGLPPARCGIVGFCMGGTVAAYVAAARPLGAAVTFYGGGVVEPRWEGVPALVELAPGFRTPWLGLYGDKDASIPPEQVERLRDAAATGALRTELVRYPEAGHGFHCDDRPKAYHEASARDAWQRTLEWFEQHIADV